MNTHSPMDRYFDSKMGYIILMLLISLCGLAALKFATLTSFPYSRSSTIFVSAQFYDKPAKYIATHVASDIEDIFAKQDGLEYTRLTVSNNALRITGKFDKSVDIDSIARDISNQLTNQPMVQNNLDELMSGLDEGDYAPDLGYVFTSSDRSDSLVSRLLESEVTPILRSMPGIQSVELYGPSDAIYIDIDQNRLNAAGLALNQVYDKVKNAFTQPASYLVDGENYEIFHHKEVRNGIQKIASLRIDDNDMHSLADIASFRVANEYTRVKARFNDKDGVVMLATFDGRTNPLSVSDDVKQMISALLENEPDLQAEEIMDSTVMLYGSIKETLISIITSIIVTCLIVYFTTRSAASALAISLSIPLSLLLAFSFYSVSLESINLITITALIIAIGLVVDDSIVVTDYLNGHGNSARPIHLTGNSQLANLRAILMVLVAITLTLVVVYLPYIFSSADYSVVSKEFGLAISIALLCSLFVSVFITPKLLPVKFRMASSAPANAYQNPAMLWYRRSLTRFAKSSLFRATTAIALMGILFMGYIAWDARDNEVAPPEDKRLLLVLSEVSPNSTSSDVQDQAGKLTERILNLPWVDSTNYVTGVPDSNMITHYVRLKELDSENNRHQDSWMDQLGAIFHQTMQQFTENPQKNNLLVRQSEALASLLDKETLSRSFVILPTDIPGASTFPIDISVMGSDTEELLVKVEQSLNEARATGLYEFLIHDAKYVSNQFKMETLVDTTTYDSTESRYFASLMAAFSQPNYVGKTPHANDNVKVYLGVSPAYQPQGYQSANATWVDDYELYDDGDRQIMKSTIQRVEPSFEPRDINKTNGLPSIQIRGTTLSGVNKYNAIQTLQVILQSKGIAEHNITFLGSSRSISSSVTEHTQITLFSLVLIFLLLTVLFDSLIAPLIIVISTVPITYFSGYIALDIFGLSDNIYTRLSILTAVGLSSKQAVIMVYEVVRIARQYGEYERLKEAIITGCSQRFNAVFMTSFSLILGVLPLIFQFSFGAVAKYNIAIVILFCMTASFITVLYLVPLVMLSLPKRAYRNLLTCQDDANLRTKKEA